MGSCTLPFVGLQDVFVVEAWACESTLILAMEMGFHNIQVEGDSLSIIKRVTLRKEDKSVLRQIVQSIIQLGKRFEELTFHFAPRSANQAALDLAMDGRRHRLRRFFVEEAPDLVEKVAKLDWDLWIRQD